MGKSAWTKARGAVHIYTGEGKGKTTAALGLALRAAGAGWQVCFVQFMKAGHYAEHASLAKLKAITVRQFGGKGFIRQQPTAQDRQEAQRAWETVRLASQNPDYGLVVADEILVAQSMGLLQEKQVLELMTHKLKSVELVLTGRGATKREMARADLVTEMNAYKHYHTQGRPAKKGVEF